MSVATNYCSWIYSSYCVTQSEWATWTQAVLTVLTFVVAMWRQEVTQNRANREKAAAADQLEAMHLSAATMKARATAISLRTEIGQFQSVLKIIIDQGLRQPPKPVFDAMSPNLNLRLRAVEALDLMESADPVLRAVHSAENIYGFFRTCAVKNQFDDGDNAFIQRIAAGILPFVDDAYEKIGVLAFKAPNDNPSPAAHAASAKSRGL